MAIDRRAFIASLGGTAAVSAMSHEARADALVSDRSLYDEAAADVEAFSARQARELVSWSRDFDTDL